MADRILVTAHQANYLPYQGFFEKILRSDLFVLVDDTQFVKRGAFGWIHRNRILSPEGQAQWLSVPILTHDRYHQRICEAEIDSRKNWARKHLRSIEFSYRKMPYFKDLFPSLASIYEKTWTHLLPLSQELIQWILGLLEATPPMQLASDLQLQGQGSDYVLDLAQKTGATHYLSGIHGRDYLDLQLFSKAGVGLVFQDYHCHAYPQATAGDFVSHLSVIDTLFSIGPCETRNLLLQGGNYATPPRG